MLNDATLKKKHRIRAVGCTRTAFTDSDNLFRQKGSNIPGHRVLMLLLADHSLTF